MTDDAIARRLVRLMDDLDTVVAHRDRVLSALSSSFEVLDKVRKGETPDPSTIEALPGFGEWLTNAAGAP